MTDHSQTPETPNRWIKRLEKIATWSERYMKPVVDSVLYFTALWVIGLFALTYFQIKFGLGPLLLTMGVILLSLLAIPILLGGIKPHFVEAESPKTRVASFSLIAVIAFAVGVAALMKGKDEVSSYRDAELEEDMKISLRSTDPSILVLSKLSKEIVPHLNAINGDLPNEPQDAQSMRDEIKQIKADIEDIKKSLRAIAEQSNTPNSTGEESASPERTDESQSLSPEQAVHTARQINE